MGIIDESLLVEVYEIPLARAARWAPHIAEAVERSEATSRSRMAAWLAQVGHESGKLRYVVEIWGPTKAQERYEGRADLGNGKPGDGFRYRGRGLIQITGRANYRECGKWLGIPLEDSPDLLERANYAALSAAWFWVTRRCNSFADSGDFAGLTRRINGGLNGWNDRVALRERAVGVLERRGLE